MLALSFNLVECPGKTIQAISLTEMLLGLWHSCRRITQSAAILCESRCIISFVSSRDAKTRWRVRCVSKQWVQYYFIVFTIGLQLQDISDDSPMWRVERFQHIEQLFPLLINANVLSIHEILSYTRFARCHVQKIFFLFP